MSSTIDNTTLTTEKNAKISTSATILSIFFTIFALIWIIAGIAAFITAIVCLGYNGPAGAKAAGFLLAFFFGPFFWLYYIYNINYCTNYYYYPQ